MCKCKNNNCGTDQATPNGYLGELKVVRWCGKDDWLLRITNKDGSYTPIINLTKAKQAVNAYDKNQETIRELVDILELVETFITVHGYRNLLLKIKQSITKAGQL